MGNDYAPAATFGGATTTYQAGAAVSNTMAAVPMGSALGATGVPTGMAVPVGNAAPLGTAVPMGAGPASDASVGGPQVRSGGSSATAASVRRKQESKSNLLHIGVAGGLVLVGGALAIIAINSGNSNSETVATNVPKQVELSPPKPEMKRANLPPGKEDKQKLRPQNQAVASPQLTPEPVSLPTAKVPSKPISPPAKVEPVSMTPEPPKPLPNPTPPVPVTVTPPIPTPPVPVTPVIDKPTREQLIALGKALTNAKAALSEQNFTEADRSLADAEKLAKLPEHQAKVGRLKVVGQYVRQFRHAIEEAVKTMEAASSFKVGSSTQVGVVETFPNKIIIRSAGVNKTYLFEDLPPGLAVAIANMKLDMGDPVSKVVTGAYIVVDKRSDSEDLGKAKTMWDEARAAGIDIGDLPLVLTDHYDFEKEAAENKK